MGLKTALIAGVTGQDGAYLARYLLSHGYRVVGTSRDAQACNTSRLERLGILKDVELLSLAPNDFRSVLKTITVVCPDEVYNLAGQSSVGLSFEQPVECMESIASGTLNFLEALRYLGSGCRFFSAGSSECFGDTGALPANETSSFRPRSPYAVAKCTAFWQVANYREAYGIYCCTGLLANHESPLRPRRFVTQKIISGVKAIKAGNQDKLTLGNLEVWRDWGWAPDYVQAMHLMLQQVHLSDFIIATGITSSLRDFVDVAFSVVGLDACHYLEVDSGLLRPSDLKYSSVDPKCIEEQLGWQATHCLSDIVEKMINDQT
ncbi:NAD dependent epimerase/dehydratase family protein [Synechococcus sp. A18-40]|nr:NAD dependent epimerase/dehydratase family protein [Synechococcus sp. A18-40]